MAKNFKSIQLVQDDSLEVMEVGNWSQKKYKLVGKYCDIFTSGMRNKWNLVYIDLFCGPGFVKNKQSGAVLKNSAMIAMSLLHKFDHYVLNDFDIKNCEILRRGPPAKIYILEIIPAIRYIALKKNVCYCLMKGSRAAT